MREFEWGNLEKLIFPQELALSVAIHGSLETLKNITKVYKLILTQTLPQPE